MSILLENDPDPLDTKPIHRDDGTLRWFLKLSDVSDDELSLEDLAKIPKYIPDDKNISIENDTGFRNIPLPIVENLLGVSRLHDNDDEQTKVFNFMKNQYSYGKDFKDKFSKFPEQFYEAIDREGKIEYKHEFDQSGNYSLRRL